MSEVIDEKVVSMEFQNGKFEKDIESTIKSLKRLDEATKIKPDSKGIDDIDKKFSILTESVNKCSEAITNKFSTAFVSKMALIGRYTDMAASKVENFLKSLTIDPTKTGLSEYEQKLDSVQTILANTRKEGTNLNDVSKVLDDLNKYADKTIYNFQQMTYNIGTFTAAGVKLQDSADAIKGIANLAAVSGANAQKASMAMYQMSQALSSGRMKLQDWNSMVNAGIGGKVFQDALTNTAEALGVGLDVVKKIKEGQVTFRDSLQEGWLTSDVLTKTLAQFTMAAEEGSKEWEEYSKTLKSWGFKDDQIKGILEMANTANDAATKVKTFTQLVDTMKESVQSGWAETWELIIGDFEEAKILWTKVSTWFDKVSSGISNARNGILKEWKDLGGRTVLLNGIADALENISNILKPVRRAFKSLIPPITAKTLIIATLNFRKFAQSLNTTRDSLVRKTLYNSFKALAYVIGLVTSTVGKLASGLLEAGSNGEGVANGLLMIINQLGLFVQKTVKTIKQSKVIDKTISALVEVLSVLVLYLGMAIQAFGEWVAESKPLSSIAGSIIDIFNALKRALGAIFAVDDATESTSGTFDKFKNTLDKANPILESFSKIFRNVANTIVNFLDSVADDPKTSLNGFLDSFIEGFLNFTKAFKTSITSFVNDIPGSVSKLVEGIKAKIDKFFNRANKDGVLSALSEGSKDLNKGIFDIFKDFGSNLKKGIDSFIDTLTGGNEQINTALHTFVDGVAGAILYTVETIERTLKLVLDIITKADWGNILLTGFKLYIIYNLMDAVTNIADAVGNVIVSFNGLLVQLTELTKMVKYLATAKLIESIVMAVVGLAASIAAIALLIRFDPVSTQKAIIAVVSMLAIVSTAMILVSKFGDPASMIKASAYLLAFSTAMGFLAGAIAALAIIFKDENALQNVVRAMGTLALAIIGILGIMKLMNGTSLIGMGDESISSIKSLIAFSGALLLLSFAVNKLASADFGNNPKEVAGKIAALLTTFIGLGILSVAASKITKSAGIQVAAMAAAIALLYFSISSFVDYAEKLSEELMQSKVTLEGLQFAFQSLVIAIATVGGITVLLSKVILDDLKDFGLTLIAMAASVYVLTKAAQQLADTDVAALFKAGVVTAAMAGIIVGLAFAIKGAAGNDSKWLGKNILYMAGAVAGLAILVEVLAYLPPNDIAKGLVVVGTMGAIIALIAAQAKNMRKNTMPILVFLTGVITIFGLLISMMKTAKKIRTGKLIAVTTGISMIMLALTRVIKSASSIKKGTVKNVIVTMLSVTVMFGTIAAMILGATVGLNDANVAKGLVAVLGATLIMYALIKLAKAMKALGDGRSEKTYKRGLEVLTKMTMILGAISLIFVIASKFSGEILKGLAGIAICTAAIEALILVSKTIKNINVDNKELNTILLMSGIVASLSLIAYALGKLPVENILMGSGVIMAMGAIVAGIVGLMFILQKVNVKTKTVATLAILTGVITVLSGLIIAFSTLLTKEQIDNAMVLAKAVAGLMITMSVSMLVMAAACKIAEKIPVSSLKGIAIVLAGVVMVVAAAMLLGGILGFLDEGAKDHIITGIGYLNDILGVVVNGLGTIVTNLLATTLNTAIVAITSFIDNLKVVAESFVGVMNIFATANPFGVTMALSMAKVIMALTAASIIDGIASFFGAGIDFKKLKDQLVAYAVVLAEFNSKVSEVSDWGPIEKAIGPAEALAEIAAKLPRSGGILDNIFGSQDMKKFGESLTAFGDGLSSYYYSVKDISDWKPVGDSIKPAEDLTALSDNIPKTDGWVQSILGESNMKKFGKRLAYFGESLVAYYKSVEKVKDWNPVGASIEPAEDLATLSDSIPRTDGVAQKILGEKDMKAFGEKLVAFAGSLVSFRDKVKDQDWSPLKGAKDATSQFIELANKLPNQEGVFEFFTGGQVDFEKFGKSIVPYGESLATFASKLKDVDNWTVVSDAIKPTQDLASIATTLSGMTTENIESACISLVKVFGLVSEIGTVGYALFKDIGANGLSAISALFESIGDLVTEVSKSANVDTTNVITFLNRFSGEVLPRLNKMADSADTKNLRTFSLSLALLTENIGRFGRLYDTLGNEQVHNVAGTLKMLVNAFRGMSGIDIESVKTFLEALRTVGDEGVKELAKAFVNDSALLTLSDNIDTLFEKAAGTKDQQQALLDSYAALGKSAGETFSAGLSNEDVTESITNLLPSGTKKVAEEATKTADKETEKTKKKVKAKVKESTKDGVADGAKEIIPKVTNTLKNAIGNVTNNSVVKDIKNTLGEGAKELFEKTTGSSAADIAKQLGISKAAGLDTDSWFDLGDMFSTDELDKLLDDTHGFGKQSEKAQEEAQEAIDDYSNMINDSMLNGVDSIGKTTETSKEELIKVNKKFFKDISKETIKGNLKRYTNNVENVLGPALSSIGVKYSKTMLKTAKVITSASNKFSESLYMNSDTYEDDMQRIAEYKKQIKTYQKEYKKATDISKKNEIYKNLQSAYEGYEQTMDEVIVHINDKVKELKNSIYENLKEYSNPFATAITETVGDVFVKAEKGTRTSFYKLTRNIGSQIEATENYKNLISQLRTAGYSEDVIKEVKEKGIADGTRIAEALLTAGKEEIKAYNKQYKTVQKLNKEEWLSDIKSKANDVKRYRNLMIKASKMGFSEQVLMEIGSLGVEDGLAYLEMLTTMSEDEKDETNKYYKRSVETSKSEANAIIGAYTYAGDESLKKLKKNLNKKSAEAIGKNVCDGLVIGMRDNTKKVTEEAKTLGKNVAKALQDVLKINSPSKITEDFGAYLDEGLAVGIDDNSKEPINAIMDMGKEGINGMESMINTLNSIVNDCMDINPVITPTLDADSLSKDINNVNGLLSLGYATSLSGDISASMSARSNGENDIINTKGERNATYNFVQNNYSPEPLNREQIYKDTRDLIKKQERTVTI